jgi:hypothetical protein
MDLRIPAVLPSTTARTYLTTMEGMSGVHRARTQMELQKGALALGRRRHDQVGVSAQVLAWEAILPHRRQEEML